MANIEHLSVLQQGVSAWNWWRRHHCQGAPDLSEADLRAGQLCGAHLSGANLRGANLRGAVLCWADLRQADLRGADLRHADLRAANLSEADMTAAQMGRTIIGEVDLSTVHGLETVVHQDPSTISLETIPCSHGKIPTSFLQGAGIPASFLAALLANAQAAYTAG